MYSLTHAFVLMEKESERNKRRLRIERKILRDASNLLDVDESTFIKNYRLNKAAFTYVLSFIEDGAISARSSSKTPSSPTILCFTVFLRREAISTQLAKISTRQWLTMAVDI
ncbi:uncharacterized protein LOC129245607 [Anastrepha obliqua]|uniref:uncharacterized protein LOC129245607 n=1 Tax=Anastrepha obliqua TaxID=95512 RepID=UPI002409B9BD|nr:uncharacterized protein LOC129245607 [Anastrepha obliqua]